MNVFTVVFDEKIKSHRLRLDKARYLSFLSLIYSQSKLRSASALGRLAYR